jgi:hypothetical protein
MTRLPINLAHQFLRCLTQTRRPRFITLLVAWLALSCGSVEAIEIVDLKWGFDGTARSETFVPLHVLVRNEASEGFVGQFVLNKRDALGNRIGAPLIVATALAPSQQNWIRFHVYLENQDVVVGSGQSSWNWRLRWNGSQRGDHRIETAPRRGSPARVMLLPRGDVAAGGSWGLPILTDELFPATVTSTDALGSVFLDHVPRWQDAQRRAFTDWLRRGGHVHILHDSTGNHPRFPSSLALLNRPSADTPPLSGSPDIRNGTIRFHSRGRSDLDASFVSSATARDIAIKTPGEAAAEPDSQNLGSLSKSSDMSFFAHFKKMTTPDHNWLIIFALAGIYWLLLFPGGLVLGMKRVDYRIVLGSIMATIALFSLAFSWIGARAYDEATVVNSLAMARHLGGNRWDVQQWSALFVLDGDTYTISHSDGDSTAAPSTPPSVGSQFYAVPGGMERVPGTISNGVGGSLGVAIPPYTLRPFLHRVAKVGPEWTPEVVHWQVGERQEVKITIRLKASPAAPPLQRAWVQYGTRVLYLSIGPTSDNATTLVQGLEPAVEVDLLAHSQDIDNSRGFRGGFLFRGQPKKTVDELYNDAVKPLLSRTLRWIDPIQPAEPLRTDRLRLFLVTDLPETFQVRQPHRTGHAGRAMFVLEAVAPVRAEISDASPAVHTRGRRVPDLAATTQQGRTR